MQKFIVDGQSILNIEWKQMDRQTDRDDYITCLTIAVGNKVPFVHSGSSYEVKFCIMMQKFTLNHIGAEIL